MTKLWAVRDEIAASDAAMITKRKFTKGARDVACDHNLAMIRLRLYDPETDGGSWVQKATATFEISMAVQENVEVLVEDGWKLARDLNLGHPEHWMDVHNAAGEHVGTITDLYMRGEVAEESGDHKIKQLDLDEPLGIDGFGDRVLVIGMRWSERVVTDTFAATSEALGNPRLVLQQLNDKGKPYAGRVIVDKKLKEWQVEKGGKVTRVNPPGVGCDSVTGAPC